MGRPAAVTPEARLWGEIGERLDRLARRDGAVRFWLRDDDAVAPSPALDRLIAVAGEAEVPLALAVIPAGATAALAARLAGEAHVGVVQHGFSHANHAPAGEKKAELGDHRPAEAVLRDLAEGRRRLAGFPRLAPILVPPWNRIGAKVAAGLGELGFRGLSLFADAAPRAPGLVIRNTHLDLVEWRPTRRFRGRETLLALLSARLDALLAGDDPSETATGILTHHLVHDEETFTFLSELLHYLARRKDCRFLSADDLLARDAAA